jgi:hypothetical protein
MTDADRFVLANVIAGLVLGFVVAASIILLDVHGVGTLLRRSDQGLVAAVLLTSGFGGLAATGLFSTAMAWLPPPAGRPGPGLGALAPAFAPTRRRG